MTADRPCGASTWNKDGCLCLPINFLHCGAVRMIRLAVGVAGLGVSIISLVLNKMFPNLNKIFVWVAFIAGLSLIGASVAMIFLPAEAQQGQAFSGSCNATGNNNTYSNNNCSFTLNQAPKPEIQVVNESRKGSGTDHVVDTIIIEIKAPYTVPIVKIEAQASDLLDMDVSPAADPSTPGVVVGTMLGKIKGGKDGLFFELWKQASGRYQIVLTKSGESKTQIKWQF